MFDLFHYISTEFDLFNLNDDIRLRLKCLSVRLLTEV